MERIESFQSSSAAINIFTFLDRGGSCDSANILGTAVSNVKLTSAGLAQLALDTEKELLYRKLLHRSGPCSLVAS